MEIKYQSRQNERSESGRSDTVTYYGSQEEMLALLEEQQISPETAGRKVVSAVVSQSDGSLWQCEIKYQNTLGNTSVSAPDDSYGKKSAQLSCGMLSMPLESHKDYRVCWNHYLAAVKGVTAVPSWWETAKSDILDSDQYKWMKSLSELPVGKDGNGKEWRMLKNPQKPGVESYDVATYQVTESAKFPSPARAGKMIAGRLNKIASPDQTFGIAGGNWKCDSASVSWNGKYWIATLTYTKSGDDNGWDADLYGNKK